MLLTDDAQIRELNRTGAERTSPPTCCPFRRPSPAGCRQPALAISAISRWPTRPWRARREEESKALADHFAHLVVHGVLHLLGYDHEVEAEAELMEGLEVKALSTLGIADPYRDMAA